MDGTSRVSDPSRLRPASQRRPYPIRYPPMKRLAPAFFHWVGNGSSSDRHFGPSRLASGCGPIARRYRLKTGVRHVNLVLRVVRDRIRVSDPRFEASTSDGRLRPSYVFRSRLRVLLGYCVLILRRYCLSLRPGSVFVGRTGVSARWRGVVFRRRTIPLRVHRAEFHSRVECDR